jgi:hypothetical protein
LKDGHLAPSWYRPPRFDRILFGAGQVWRAHTGNVTGAGTSGC